MDAIEIRELTIDEIGEQLDQRRDELMRLRFRQATGELTDHNQMKQTRKIIARLLTVLKERELEEGEE